MKTAIIGAGNMGGSIARGLAKGTIIPANDIIVSNPTQSKLDVLKAEFPALQTTRDNQEAVTGAELIILAVKPWLMKSVVSELKLKSKQILISVAAGIPFEELAHYVADKEMTMFRLIPNTAISEMESMTLISSRNASKEQEQLLLDISTLVCCSIISDIHTRYASGLWRHGRSLLFSRYQSTSGCTILTRSSSFFSVFFIFCCFPIYFTFSNI